MIVLGHIWRHEVSKREEHECGKYFIMNVLQHFLFTFNIDEAIFVTVFIAVVMVEVVVVVVIAAVVVEEGEDGDCDCSCSCRGGASGGFGDICDIIAEPIVLVIVAIASPAKIVSVNLLFVFAISLGADVVKGADDDADTDADNVSFACANNISVLCSSSAVGVSAVDSGVAFSFSQEIVSVVLSLSFNPVLSRISSSIFWRFWVEFP